MKKIIFFILIIFLPVCLWGQLPTPGLVAWYPFCGNTNDLSGDGHHMVNSGATLTTDRFGNPNCAYDFNGINSIIYYSTVFPSATNLTYSFWMNAYAIQNGTMPYNGNTNINGLGFIINNGTLGGFGNQISLMFGGISLCTSTPVALNQWHHVVLRKTGGFFEVIIDTIVVATYSGTFNPPNGRFAMGLDYTDGTDPYRGKLDDIAIYGRALTDAEIKQLYHVNPDVNGFSLGRDTTLCSGSFTLNAPPEPSTYAFLWSSGDTGTTTTVSTAGTYWLKVTNSYGCYVIDTLQVSVGVYVNLGADTGICPESTFTLFAHTDTDSCIRIWNTGDTTSSVVVSHPGTYWVTVSHGSCVGSDTVHVQSYADPTVTLGPDITKCEGQSVTLQSATTYFGSPNYVWSSGATTPSISVTKAGKYWLTVQQNGCIGTDTVDLHFFPNPVAILGNDTFICPNDSIKLVCRGTKNVNYTWNTGSTDSSINIAIAGTYKVIVNQSGCIGSDSISVKQLTAPTVYLDNDTSLCSGELLQLAIHTNGADANYLWSEGSTGNNFQVVQSGSYWVTASNSCGTAADTINVTFEFCNIWFPSAFTPNGDGLNDIIRVRGNLEQFSGFSFSIFNRFGQRVFYTENIYDGWDGLFNGGRQDLGTYYYQLFYVLHGKKNMMKGDFQLIR